MWKNINQVMTIKDNLENTIHDKKCIADQLNKYFVEIGPKLPNNLPVSPRNFSEYFGQVDCEFNLAWSTTISFIGK